MISHLKNNIYCILNQITAVYLNLSLPKAKKTRKAIFPVCPALWDVEALAW